MKKEYIVAMAILVSVTVILALASGLISVSSVSNVMSKGTPSSIEYHSEVCKNVIRYSTGEIEDLGCTPNIVTNAGLNHLKEFLGQGNAGSVNASIITVGNGTAPVAASTTLNNEITDCGFSRQGATYTSIGTGNWSLTKTWTDVSCNGLVVNTTALFNASTSGTMFAGNSFTSVTLQSNDQLNVTWTIWVTSS
jgi:hypothetical protein